MPASDSSNETFYIDETGTKQDAELHASLLDDDEAEEEDALDAVLSAIEEDGVSEQDALDAFGTRNTAARLAAHRESQTA